MKKLIICLGLLLATAASVFAMSYEEAQKQDKPVVVMFHMHGCGACRKFSPIFDKYASQFSNKFNFVKEDIDTSKIAKTLDFATVPAIFIIQPKTHKSTRIDNDCAWNKECFTKALQNY